MLCEKSIKYSNFYIVFFGMHGLLYDNDIYQNLFAQHSIIQQSNQGYQGRGSQNAFPEL